MDLQEGTLAGHYNDGLHWQWKRAFESGLSDGRADSTACGVVFFLRSVLGVTCDLSICVLYPSEHAMYINICICNIGERTVRCSRKLWCDHDF